MRFKVNESFKRPESVVSAAAKHLERTSSISTQPDGRSLVFRTNDNSISAKFSVSQETKTLYHVENEFGEIITEPTESLDKVYSNLIEVVKEACFG